MILVLDPVFSVLIVVKEFTLQNIVSMNIFLKVNVCDMVLY